MRTYFYTLLLVSYISFSAHASTTQPTKASQKAVLVTGASSGIGKQIALTLSKNGYYVYAGARKAKDLAELNKLPNMQGVRLDVTVQKDIDTAVKHIRSEGRGLYGVVNNAGVFLLDSLIEVSESDMKFIMDVNILGPYRVTKAFAPLLIENKGRVTTIGSVAGIFSVQLLGPYGMTKHAMESYSEALSQEMKKFDVAVSIVEPGNFRSDIMKNMEKRLAAINSGKRPTLFKEEIESFASFTQSDRSHHAKATPVADAVLDFMSSVQPKFRYLVTPNKRESDYAIKRSLKKAVELNHSHMYSQDDTEMTGLLKTLLTDVNE